jgi:hypothetical protein
MFATRKQYLYAEFFEWSDGSIPGQFCHFLASNGEMICPATHIKWTLWIHKGMTLRSFNNYSSLDPWWETPKKLFENSQHVSCVMVTAWSRLMLECLGW